jgi:hypothetical protein
VTVKLKLAPDWWAVIASLASAALIRAGIVHIPW